MTSPRSEAGGPAATFMPHILLVEDNVINIKIAERHLKRGGYRVSVATDGLKCVEAVEQYTDIDLILLGNASVSVCLSVCVRVCVR